MTAPFPSRSSKLVDRPQRAVIDIGSNTVRLVVYSGPQRAPAVWLNEKVTARLGRDLASTGRMPDKAMDMALGGIARYACILKDIEVTDVQVVATAAVRDAENGPEFVARVRDLGLDIKVLSGEEEAIASAYGVIGAFPGAHGVVADLGGGSLELVAIGDGESSHGVSLPLGTLRLPALREKGTKAFNKAVRAELEKADWATHHEGPLYMVGGTWRAMATFAMHKSKYPLTDPQAYCMTMQEADKIAKKLSSMKPDMLCEISGISSSRAAGLPDAAAMLRPLLAQLQPDGLVFSSWGLREGLLFRSLSEGAQKLDPLLAAVSHFTEPRGASPTDAMQIAAWTSDAARGNGNGTERLRLAATMLALAQWRLEPNMRLSHSIDWALDKRWLGLDHQGRAMIAAALRAANGKPEPTADLQALADDKALHEAAAWGLAFRLCRRLGAGSRISLLSSRLKREGDVLRLWLEPGRRELVSDQVENELARLAAWLGCEGILEA
ncbi:Ppx/GppA family phosphatase [Aurantiacibacter poecillastricola]|uniref:Ppx/GppA family phosphatase n=1 Tax=Aurantiacibacter poecillastricola TaxID=3064385 RepID=UPI00273D5953|nr:Ppx/GppA family phosphatase [Aurantiacibacter sp. 219JJ12-13]MDP5260048.1 Ppx/GppA family phosphatase [Aurantiacibacter sp. 219JJ12-13]